MLNVNLKISVCTLLMSCWLAIQRWKAPKLFPCLKTDATNQQLKFAGFPCRPKSRQVFHRSEDLRLQGRICPFPAMPLFGRSVEWLLAPISTYQILSAVRSDSCGFTWKPYKLGRRSFLPGPARHRHCSPRSFQEKHGIFSYGRPALLRASVSCHCFGLCVGFNKSLQNILVLG